MCSSDLHEQQAEVEAGAVELNRQVVGVGVALHGDFEGSAANELHGGQGAQEKHRGDAEGMDGKPAHRKDRVVAWRGGGRLGHGYCRR